jgi:hypothetical protein
MPGTCRLCRSACLLALLLLLWLASAAPGQTADDITKLIERLSELDSIDLCKLGVKYRAGLLPPLAAADADESAMTVLKDPHEPQGKGKPGAAGWYRVSFVVPAKFGKFDASPDAVVESNVLGSWEIYAYRNGEPAGPDGGLVARSNEPETNWVRSVLTGSKPGDRVTIAILATSYPWGGGSPEGFALRHLRLGRRTSGAYGPFYWALFDVRNKLRTLQGDELKAYREKVKGPLARLDAVFAAAEGGNQGAYIQVLVKARADLDAALKK